MEVMAKVGNQRWGRPPYGLAVLFVVMAIVNGLNGSGAPGFPKDNAELSKLNPTYVTPDGPTFAIWGLIYVMELITVVQEVRNPTWPAPRWRSCLGLAFVLNSVWLFVFAQEMYVVSFVVMACYLLTLLAAYEDLDYSPDSDVSFISKVAVSMNTAWIIVATALNALIAYARGGFGDALELPVKGEMLLSTAGTQGIAEVIVVSLVIFAALALAIRRDLPFAGTLAWALWGVQRQQAAQGAEQVAFLAGLAAKVVVGTCALAALMGALRPPAPSNRRR